MSLPLTGKVILVILVLTSISMLSYYYDTMMPREFKNAELFLTKSKEYKDRQELVR